ncbi:hypothetical protein ACUHMQ_12785 [Chitinimonas sp. PSY-7]|uniref:hypothetical protein n=1 Tax=Chitinimonas sp. PSY-7 TaxID=3459088 RepID=UPI004040092C
MTAIHFHIDTIHALKKSAYRQIVGVKHSHWYEALARAFSYNNSAAMKMAAKSVAPFSSPETADYRPVDLEQLVARLCEFGYGHLALNKLSFTAIENGRDIIADSLVSEPSTQAGPLFSVSPSDPGLQKRYQHYFESLGIHQALIDTVVTLAIYRNLDGDWNPEITSVIEWPPSVMMVEQPGLFTLPIARRLETLGLMAANFNLLLRHRVISQTGNRTLSFPVIDDFKVSFDDAVVYVKFNPEITKCLNGIDSEVSAKH